MSTKKPGIKTSEFWLTAIATAVNAMLVSGLFGDGSVEIKILGVVAITLSTMGYAVSRGIAKK